MVPDGKKITAYIAILAIRSCKTLFQLPHGCCRFSPTCSEYAKEALEKHPFFSALTLISRRLLSCHPLHKGGFDPVPKKL